MRQSFVYEIHVMESMKADGKIMVFDLGKVLVDFNWMIVVARMAERSGKSLAAFEPLIANPELLLTYETGLISSREFYEKARELLGYPEDYSNFCSDFGDMFSELTPMVEVNRSIRKNGIPTYILSNTNEIAIETIKDQFPFFSEFDGYIYSYIEKAMKPDPAIYKALEKLAGKSPAQIVFIDDNAANIEAAIALGWAAHRHTDHDETVGFLKSQGML